MLRVHFLHIKKIVYKAIWFLLLINAHSFCYSQGKEANVWCFGAWMGFDFNQGSPPDIISTGMHCWGNGSASIADSNGNLLFYSDGFEIWNKNHVQMENGDLLGGESSQGAIIIPKPGFSDLYYIFYTYCPNPGNPPLYLQYSMIDMDLDGGLGAVVDSVKDITMFLQATDCFSAVQHSNNQDFWLVSHVEKGTNYYAWLITESGVSENAVISNVGSYIDLTSTGVIRLSPNGKKIAIGLYFDSFFEILDFNNSTGIVSDSNIVYDPTVANTEGIEFSPNDQYLYLNYGYKIFQYDLKAGTPQQILDSKTLVSVVTTFGGSCQIAPDGKIYINTGSNQDWVSIIHEPNNKSPFCNFEYDALNVGGSNSGDRFPTFIQSYFADPEFVTQNNCLGDPTEFTILQTNGIDSVFWKFNDFPNMPYDTSTSFNPVYTFSYADTFLVELTAYSNLNVRTVIQEVIIHPIPEPDLGNDTLLCNASFSITLNANCDGDIFGWSTGQFGTPEITVSDTGWYWVNVSKEGCSGIDSIYIGLHPAPVMDTSNLLITQASCGMANGSIEGITVGGTNPLDFYWINIAGDTIGNTLGIYNLAAGQYTLLVHDGNECDNSFGPFIINDDGMMSVDSVNYLHDHCSQSIGSIEIFAPVGGDVLYSIDGGNTYLDNGGVFPGLSAGSYHVMIKDENDCEGIYVNNPVVIQNIAGPEVVSIDVLPEQDYGQNGQIDISAIVSWGDPFYSIDNGASFQQGYGLFTSLSAGTYTCVVQDAYGCDTTFQVIVDHISTTPLEAIAGDGNTCIGNAVVSPLQLNNFNEVAGFQVKITYDMTLVQCDGYLNLNPELEAGFSASIVTATGEIYLYWTGDDPLSLPEEAVMVELVFSALEEGNSAIDWQTGPGESEFLDMYGLVLDVDYYTGTLKIFTRPEIDMLDMQEVCEGDDIYIQPVIEGGSGDKSYYWTGPDGFESTDSILSLTDIIQQQHGLYTLQVNDTLDCDDASEFNLIVNPPPDIAFEGYDTLYVEPGYQLHAGAGYIDYQWNTGAQGEYITIDSTGLYSVEVTSYKGCYNNASVYIRWSSIPIYVPNAFTPDGDGLNDIFLPVVRYDFVATYRMCIFNRWGQMLFESNDLSIGWDGTFKGEQVPGGVYVYRIDYTSYGTRDKNPEVLSGEVVVLLR